MAMSLSERMEAEQRGVCAIQVCEFAPVSGGDQAGLACFTLGMEPIKGLRHPIVDETTGWYIWAGDGWSDDPEFFQPVCVDHLLEKLPAAASFLALPPGYRFLCCANGHIDIWLDESLLRV